MDTFDLAESVTLSSGLELGDSVAGLEWHDEYGPVRLAEFVGKPVVITFFATEWDPARDHQFELLNGILPSSVRRVEVERDGSGRKQIQIELEDESVLEVPIFENLDCRGALAAQLGVDDSDALVVIDPTGALVFRRSISGSAALSDAWKTSLQIASGNSLSRRQFVATAVAALAAFVLVPRSFARDVEGGSGGAQGSTSSPSGQFSLHVNGRMYSVPADARITVLSALRDYLGLTGTKKGCDHGQCGACTVHLNGRRVNSCLVLAAQAQGSKITTIEGVAHGEQLHAVQKAFIEHDGFQCGYCTPGQIMSAISCIEEGHVGSAEEIREWMSGNICRCGAYQGILNAVQSASRSGGVK